jgi:RNase P subunit RPR2
LSLEVEVSRWAIATRNHFIVSTAEIMVKDTAEAWIGFPCKQCGTPLAVQRSTEASKSGERAARGWRVTCTGCGATEYYEPGTTMIRITISN